MRLILQILFKLHCMFILKKLTTYKIVWKYWYEIDVWFRDWTQKKILHLKIKNSKSSNLKNLISGNIIIVIQKELLIFFLLICSFFNKKKILINIIKNISSWSILKSGHIYIKRNYTHLDARNKGNINFSSKPRLRLILFLASKFKQSLSIPVIVTVLKLYLEIFLCWVSDRKRKFVHVFTVLPNFWFP